MDKATAESRALVVAPKPPPLDLAMVNTFQALAPLFLHERGQQAIPASIKTPQQALAVMTLGAELGVGPVTAFANVAIINGVCQPMAQLMMAVTRARDPSAVFTFPSFTLEKMTVSLMRSRFAEPLEYSISLKDVPEATKRRPVWKTHPLDMLTWNAVKHVCRLGASDLIMVGGGLADDTAPESGPLAIDTLEDGGPGGPAAGATMGHHEDTAPVEAELVAEPLVQEDADAEAPAEEPDPDDIEIAVKAVLTEAGVRGLKTAPELSRWLGLDPKGHKPLRSEWFIPAKNDGVPYSVSADLAINCLGQVSQEIRRRGISTMAAVATVDPLRQLRALRETQAQGALPAKQEPAPEPEDREDPPGIEPEQEPVEAS